MVISLVSGGIGNQLFQYAAGRALALRLKTSFRLDTSFFVNNTRTKRKFELRRFCISAPEATPLEKWLLQRLARPRVARVMAPLRKLGLPVGTTILHERKYTFEEEVASVTGHVYVHGMRQSERYFSASADILRQDLAFRDEPDDVNRALLEQIQSVEAVSLHVRRGDYLDKPEVFGTCGLEYYRAAINELVGGVTNPHFFIFSDDPDWTKENIRVPFPCTYVTHNLGRKDVEDMRLMSHCRHFIIPNSTFSWWGAWLSRNPTKLVIAPRRWFGEGHHSAADLVPETWVRV